MSTENIPLSRPDITSAEVEAAVAVLTGDRLSIGPRIEAFEQAVARIAGRKYGIGVNSGTSGLHLCVRALGISEGDEVITTPFSFVATTNCLLFERARPVFVDIDPETYNIDAAGLAGAVTDQTKAILPVEVFGNPAGFDQYERIARKHGLAMIEDCCEALAARLSDRPAGSFGDCGVFAFYPNKQITTAEGGVIVTDSRAVRDLCISMRNQGRASDEESSGEGSSGRGRGWLSHVRLGYNYRMSEVNAAIGVVQAERLDEILEKRRCAASMYDEALGELEEVHLPPMADRRTASWFVYVIRLADRFTGTQRDSILDRLRQNGVGCSNYFVPIHMQPYVMDLLGTRRGQFPITERLADRTIALPFFAGLTGRQIQAVTDALKAGIRQA